MRGIMTGPRAIEQESLGPEDFAIVASWGMDTVRLYFPWHKVESPQGTYDEAYIEKLLNMAGDVNDAGLDLIPTMFWNTPIAYGWPRLEELFSGVIEQDFYDVWSMIADRLVGYDVVAFDPSNEPRPWTAWQPMTLAEREAYETAWTRISNNVATILKPIMVTRGPFAGAQHYCVEPSYWSPPPGIHYFGGYWPTDVSHNQQPWTGTPQDLLDYWSCALAFGCKAIHEIGISCPVVSEPEPSALDWLDTSLSLFNQLGLSWFMMHLSRIPDMDQWSLIRSDGSLHPIVPIVLENLKPTPISRFGKLATALSTIGFLGILWDSRRRG